MIAILSPAKNLDMAAVRVVGSLTQPELLDHSVKLISKLKKQSAGKLGKLMKISPALGQLNHTRFQRWVVPFTAKNAKPAIRAFNGEVYRGLNASDFNADDEMFATSHVRILSGLYGVLRPLDMMQAYRLEMGCRFPTGRNQKNLYQFWGDRITDVLNDSLASAGGPLLNLASAEYFKAVNTNALNAQVVTPIFKDLSKGKYKVLMAYGKLERGRLCRYMIKNRITDPKQLTKYKGSGYRFSEKDSSENELVFLRDERPTAQS